jgi:hypothetical protein
MIRNLKMFGLAAMAIFALSAVAVASASADEFHGESAPVNFSGSQTTANVFTTNAGTVKCATATFSGTNATTTSSTAELAATYGGCKAFGFLEVPVTMNGCKYKFHLGAATVATTDITGCNAGKKIEVDAPGCVVTVGEQTGLGSITLSNAGAGTSRDINASVAVTGITYTVPAGCILTSAGTFSNGEYTGGATIKGVGQGVWVA